MKQNHWLKKKLPSNRDSQFCAVNVALVSIETTIIQSMMDYTLELGNEVCSMTDLTIKCDQITFNIILDVFEFRRNLKASD